MKTVFVSLILGVSVLLLLSGLTVSADHALTLKFSENPVMTGSDVTLHCEKTKGNYVEAYFYFNGTKLGPLTHGTKLEPKLTFTKHKVQQSDEGFYSCSTQVFGKSPESRLRVTDPPTTSDPPHTTSSTTSGPPTTALYTDTTCHITDSTASSSTRFSLVIRFFIRVLVFSPYCICTILMVSVCCSMKTGHKLVVSMKVTQDDEEYDDITAVTTKRDLRAA